MRKDIDLRSEITGDPLWIVFFGRNPSLSGSSATGHAFVGLGREDSSNQMSWIEGFGLYPREAGADVIMLGRVPGQIQKDAWTNSDVIVSCRVNRTEFEKVSSLRDRWAQAEYQLIYQDCVTFCLEAAQQIGLKRPPRETFPDNVTLPVNLIRALGQINDTQDFPSGDWTSNDPAQRWRLILELEQGSWIEKAASGATLRMPTRILRLSERSFKVERENSDAVLTFLGARDSIRQALLARGVQPSYMTLTRASPTQFQAKWFGLRWTLDAQNNLNTIIQPGQAPGASFTFVRKT